MQVSTLKEVSPLRDKCGVFAIFNHPDASRLTYLGLYALQHRGQESAGISVSNRKRLTCYKEMGLVADVFKKDILDGLDGDIALGHIRYSTTGSSLVKNAQPFQVNYSRGSIAIAHNGNIVNAKKLRNKLEKTGSIFQSTMDSELIVHLIAKYNRLGFEKGIIKALQQIKGAYSLGLLTENKLMAVRDPNGFRPLCLGKLGNSYVISSETCALDLINAKYIRDIEPGEIVIISDNGIRSIKPFATIKQSLCVFEYIYFARPDSNIEGHNIALARKMLGRELAKEAPCDADLVIPIPDSGNYAALGYSEQSNIPFEMGVVRNHYIGRTFIQPSQYIRDFSVKIKLNPVKEIIEGKNIVVIEDSIVRGTTSKTRIKALKDCGAKKIHMRVTCPPPKFPCYYGIDFPSKKELIASNKSVKKIEKFLGLDSLAYLSLEGMLKSIPLDNAKFCTACFSGKHPLKPGRGISKLNLER